jgi:hypothetical protein
LSPIALNLSAGHGVAARSGTHRTSSICIVPWSHARFRCDGATALSLAIRKRPMAA